MKRLVTEGVTARQIRHPNIVAVYDVAQLDGQPYLTMEYVKGGTLRTWMVNAIRSGQETKLETAIGIVKAILAGLAEAHRMGVVHRDLKPENILLCGDPAQGDFSLKILDFGIAKAVDSATLASSGSGSSSGSVGTPLYMAPEQKTAPDTVGPAADLYSVSVILYELLMEALPQTRWEPPSEHRADVPQAIDGVIEKGMMTRARSRFQSASEYVAALDQALQNRAPIVGKVGEDTKSADRKDPAPKPAEKKDQAPKQNWRIIAGTVAATILVLAVIGSMMGEDSPGPGPQPQPQPAPYLGGDNGGQVAPQPAPQSFNASGTWYDDAGSPFQVSHDGTSFTATGFVVGTGPVRLTGTLTTSTFAFQVMSDANGMYLGAGSGTLEPDGRHLAYVLSNAAGVPFFQGRFHINHTPGS
jgi:serine/threonine protein kinase